MMLHCFFLLATTASIVFSDDSTNSITHSANHNETCEHKADGKYVISDVLSYLLCNNRTSMIIECPKDTIFDPKSLTCKDSTRFELDTFCNYRTVELNGNYRHPWDCHGFITCIYGLQYERKCSHYENFTYNPYKDACNVQSLFPCKEVKNYCSDKEDGNYPKKDVFGYIHCLSGKRTDMKCPSNLSFNAKEQKCTEGKYQSLNEFCLNRDDGDWQNPWDCHSLIKCSNKKLFKIPCMQPYLVYNPYYDECDYPQEYPCKQIASLTNLASKNKALDFCADKKDGMYSKAKFVFEYIECSNGKHTDKTCPENTVYDPLQQKCVHMTIGEEKDFCKSRGNGDWQDPFDCHSLYKCFMKATYKVPCQMSQLVYDPESDACVYSSQYTCKQIKTEISLTTSDENCLHRSDGNYGIRDVFAYLNCKNHNGKFVPCENDDIFDEGQGKCVSSDSLTKDTFCRSRGPGNYRDPWECHKYIVCQHSQLTEMKCPGKDLVYDPYPNMCQWAFLFNCKEMVRAKEDIECKGKADGSYPIADVFEYLICKDGDATYGKCQHGYIFDNIQLKCVTIVSESIDSFCRNRTDGDWTNPWNCYTYLLCNSGRSAQKACLINGFVFNPYLDVCVRLQDYPCRTAYLAEPNGICTGKSDGNYPQENAFDYLQCKNGTGKVLTCPDNQYFDHVHSKCVDGSSYSIDTFCKAHKDGVYQDLLDCHKLLSCVSGKAYLQSCYKPLVYNPETQQCADDYKCRQLNSKELSSENDKLCSGKKDGVYAVADAFSYLQCKNQSGKILSCGKNQLFDHVKNKCVDGSSYSISEFCKQHKDGTFQNLLNCHGFISCVGGMVYEQPCPGKTLVYDPYFKQCEFPSLFPCKQLEPKAEPNGVCTGKYDGNYSQANAFDYLKCKNGRGKVLTCPDNQFFDDVHSKCVDGSSYSIDTFCKVHKNGEYQDLLDCHKYLLCTNGYVSVFSCFNLVYNPEIQQCEERKCRQLNSKELSSENDKLCSGKKDGVYAVADAFSYLQCKNQSAKILSCGKNQLFDHVKNKCVDGSSYSISEFCKQHKDGVFQNLLNCHGFISCVGGMVYEQPCPGKTLVYDPYFKQCEFPSLFPCKQLEPKAFVDKQCQGLADGKYNLPDMFSYFECKSGKATNKTCSDNFVFDPSQHECIDGSKFSKDHFCKDRTTGNYQNPWNCHGYISCVHETMIERNCAEKNLVYDPYKDSCEEKYQCKSLKKESKISFANDCTFAPGYVRSVNPCFGRTDGNYQTPNAFKYLVCKENVASYVFCNLSEIYDPNPAVEKCVRPTEQNITLDNFCQYRCDGDTQFPWDCHLFAICFNGKMGNPQPCHVPKTALVFDSALDKCVEENCQQLLVSQHAQVALQKNVNINDICLTLPDGYYATRDVFNILQCVNHSSKYIPCPEGTIYGPGNGKNCVPAKQVTIDNFCDNRTEGNWQDPWNCHSFISCHAKQPKELKCSPFVVLNYDPANDLCEYPSIRKCQQIKTEHYHKTNVLPYITIRNSSRNVLSCKGRKDGFYAIADVAVVMQCHLEHAHYVHCNDGQIFLPTTKQCTDIKTVNKDNFCVGRRDQNWRNPWNCHRYITCQLEQFFDRPCSIKTTLNYNPYKDICEFPRDYKCVNITSSAI